MNNNSKGTKWGIAIGAFICMAIPFALGTTMGLSARELDLFFSQSEIIKGLVAPGVAVLHMNRVGAWWFSALVSSYLTYIIHAIHIQHMMTSDLVNV
jgi:hypothetical protein